MSAIPSPVAVTIEPRPVPGLALLRATGRMTLVFALALLVPGEAARIGADLGRSERPRRPR